MREKYSVNIPVRSTTRWRHETTVTAIRAPRMCPTVRRSANSSLSINTNHNHNINIKAEPISPPRDHLSQPGYVTQAHGPPHHHSSTTSSSRAELGRSPADSISSSCSSHEGGSDREEQQRPDFHSLPVSRSESPTVKRMRMDSWVT